MNRTPMEARAISLPEAARLFGVSASTARKWAADGEMPKPLRVGGRLYFDRRVFEQWMETKFAEAE